MAAVAFGQTVALLRTLVSSAPAVVVVVAPVVGVLVCAAVLRLVPDAGGGGIPQVRRAFAGSPVRGRVAGAKAAAASAVLGSGGSGGAEGPVVHISAALGTAVATAVRLPGVFFRPVAAAAVAGGVAASFGAPLAGVVLVAEVLVDGPTCVELLAVVVGSAAGAVTGWALPGSPLRLPDAAVGGLPWGAVVAGLFGVALAWVLYFGGAWAGWVRGAAGSGSARRALSGRARAVADHSDAVADGQVQGDAGLAGSAWFRAGPGMDGSAAPRVGRFRRVVGWAASDGVRAVIGGVAVGLLVLAAPAVAGVGQPGVAIGSTAALLALAAGKVVATGVTVGAGGVVGTIGPALFVGAAVGSALPGAGGAAAGMAACLAAASRECGRASC
ncbi:chloride channel protein, partial [Amycolatopsis sp. NPDC004368]